MAKDDDGLDGSEVLASRARARGAVQVRERDQRTEVIANLMAGHSWTKERAYQLAEEWGCAFATIEGYASDAAMFLRMCRDPEKVQQWGLYGLNRIAEDSATPPQVKVAAYKVALDATQPRARDADKPTPALDAAHRNERIRELLRNPPPELVAILEDEWGPRRV